VNDSIKRWSRCRTRTEKVERREANRTKAYVTKTRFPMNSQRIIHISRLKTGMWGYDLG
jgi:hypothetical protein